jgi:hypothetical protein
MRHSRLVLAALVVGGAAAAALLGRWPWKRLEVTAPPIQVASEPVETRRDTLQQGESLGSLLARHGVEPIDLASVVELLGVDARRLRAGMVFSFQYRQDEDQPREMMVRTGPELRVRLVRSDDAWTAERRPIAWTTDTLRIGGTIESSLYEALDQSPTPRR